MREQKNSVQQKYAELIMVVVLLFAVGMMIWLMADNNQNTIKTDKIPTPEQISNKRITDTQSEIKLPKNNQSALQPKPLRKHENNSLTLNSPTTNSQISGINSAKASAINSAKAGTMYDDGDSIYIKERGNNCLWRTNNKSTGHARHNSKNRYTYLFVTSNGLLIADPTNQQTIQINSSQNKYDCPPEEYYKNLNDPSKPSLDWPIYDK